jgi:G:T-mismatch repair DNA endonuclease (very short patch repair protein)
MAETNSDGNLSEEVAEEEADEDILFDLVCEREASSLKNRVNHYFTRIKLKPSAEDRHDCLLVDVWSSLRRVIENGYEKFIASVAKAQDLAQMIFKSDKMDHYVSTVYRPVSDLTADHLLTEIEKVQNSGLSVKLSDVIHLEFVHIRLDPGWNRPGGRGRKDLIYYQNHHQKKSCKQVVPAGTNTCLPACVLVGNAHGQVMEARKKVRELGTAAAHRELKEAEDFYKEISKHGGSNKKLKILIYRVYTKWLGIDKRAYCDLTHLKKMEERMEVSFKVVSIPDQLKIIYTGPKRDDRDYVYLLYTEPPGSTVGHYELITNVRGFFATDFYCTDCDVAYSNEYDHRCQATITWWCFSCYRRNCTRSDNPTECDSCGCKLHSPECAQHHKNKRCSQQWRCNGCHKRFARNKVIDFNDLEWRYATDEEMELNHHCDYYFCRECKEEVPSDHRCFVKRKEFKDKIQRLLFFDVETDQSSKTHVVNHVHATYYVQTEEERAAESEAQERKKEVKKLKESMRVLEKERRHEASVDNHEEVAKINERMEKVADTLRAKFQQMADHEAYLSNHQLWTGQWLEESWSGPHALFNFFKKLTDKLKGYTCLAHNMKGFDGVFILKNMLDQGIIPDVIVKGQKILQIEVDFCKLRFIDSFNFLPMALAKLPGALGLECGPKGYFPHFSNTPENQAYVGPFPEPKFYGVQHMSSEERERFYVWYREQQGKVFDFKAEMHRYCKQDVDILKESCLAYRKLMCQETGCDPFSYVTLASVCSAVYMTRYMPEETIARVPPAGYEGYRYSDEGVEWVEYKRRHEGVTGMRHALNGGEVRVHNYLVDGFDEENKTVYEYYGCFFHGCPKCFRETLRNPNTNKRLRQALVETWRREQDLRSMGYKVESMWGCAWKEQKRNDPAVARKVAEMKIPAPLVPRDAFFGGRTECFKVWTNDGPIAYQDVTSLYPWVNCTMEYPVGHPTIILSNFAEDLSQYFGLIKCSVLAPQDLHLPVLPMRTGKDQKLVFALCRTCAEQSQTRPCTHTEEERMLMGTWFSEELKLAVEKGYMVKEVACVWHFEEKTTDLFAGYMRTFYKLKLTSSKLLFTDLSQVEEFIREVERKEGIKIEGVHEFRENPGLRQLTKLMLNNLWGRFGMQENMSKSEFVTAFETIEELFQDVTREIQGVRVINERVSQVIYKSSDADYLACSRDTNIFIAVATTAWARIRLYRELEKVGTRAIYCDTDSIVYKLNTAEPQENLETGNFLGELTNELDADDHIVEFVSGGPKNYAYRTAKGKVCVKVKGFTPNSTNISAFSFDSIKKVILNGITVSDDADPDDGVEIPRAKRRRLDNQAQKDAFLTDHLKTSDSCSALTGPSGISVFNPFKIARTKDWQLVQRSEQKLYSFCFDKRVILPDCFDTKPFGFLSQNC